MSPTSSQVFEEVQVELDGFKVQALFQCLPGENIIAVLTLGAGGQLQTAA